MGIKVTILQRFGGSPPQFGLRAFGVTASPCSWRAIGLDEAAGGARAEGRGAAEGGGLPRPRHCRRRQPQHLSVPRESSRAPPVFIRPLRFSFLATRRRVWVQRHSLRIYSSPIGFLL